MSSDRQLLPGGDDYLEQSSILADPRQRRILSILRNRSQPLTERDLSVQLTARETGRAPSNITEDDHQPIQVDLYHRCLPKLESEGWITRHPAGIIAAEPLSFGDEGSTPPDVHNPTHLSWEAVGALLARPQRQDLVSIIAGQHGHLTLEELATAVTERSHTTWPADQRGDEPTLLSTLHHVDLPKLAEVGLIKYSPEEKTLTRTASLETLVNRTDLDNRLPEGSDMG